MLPAVQKRRSGKRAPAGARLGEESPRIGPRFFKPGELYAMSAGHLMTPGPASRDLQSDSADTMLATRPSSAKPARNAGTSAPLLRGVTIDCRRRKTWRSDSRHAGPGVMRWPADIAYSSPWLKKSGPMRGDSSPGRAPAVGACFPDCRLRPMAKINTSSHIGKRCATFGG